MQDWCKRITILYDGDCGFCDRTRRLLQRWDLERLQNWKPFERPEQSIQVRIADKVYTGFAGFKAIIGSNSLTYFAIAVVLSLVHHRWMGIILLLTWSPLIVPVGELGYRWVARHSNRMAGFSGS